MKGLLHSKIFKKNLKKWLCMYVGALLLLTTVVTYSKYISKYNVDDEARVTKFDVTIDNVENAKLSCSEETVDNTLDKKTINCIPKDNVTFRPTEKIPYEFIVTPNFEVSTLLATTIYIPANFTIVSLEENGTQIYNLKENIKDDSISIKNLKNKNEKGEDYINATIITVKREINASEDNANVPKNYKVTIKYNYDENTYLKDETIKNNLSVIKVGYSATQIKN